MNIAARSARSPTQTTPVTITTTPMSQSPAPTTEPLTLPEEPAPVVAPVTVETPTTTTHPVIVVYENCAEVWAAQGGPINRGEPGYSSDLDSDGDGTGCENRPK